MDKDREIENLRTELKDTRKLLDWWEREYEILVWDWNDDHSGNNPGPRPYSLDELGANPPKPKRTSKAK